MKLSEIETEMELTQLEYDTQGYLSTNQADLLIKHMRLLISSQKKLLQEKVEREAREQKAFDYYSYLIYRMTRAYGNDGKQYDFYSNKVEACNNLFHRLGLTEEAQAYKNKALEERKNLGKG